MIRRTTLVVLALVALGFWVWRSQLFTVSRPGQAPQSLVLRGQIQRSTIDLDVVLPAVPVGMTHLRDGDGVLLIHYWAPWEQHSAIQAALLDSLLRLAPYDHLRAVLVCFDPFPSVARFVARHRLRLNVLLDHDRSLRKALPCPSVPYTYVLDRSGHVAVGQAGEVDWLGAATGATLRRLLAERDH